MLFCCCDSVEEHTEIDQTLLSPRLRATAFIKI